MADEDAARLERLLARHRDATVVEPLPGRPALVRRDQLLVAAADLPAVEDAVRRWSDARHDGPGVARLMLRSGAKVDVCELSAALRARRPGTAVAPNHLVHAQPMWWAGPAGPPRPAPPIPAPAVSHRRTHGTRRRTDGAPCAPGDRTGTGEDPRDPPERPGDRPIRSGASPTHHDAPPTHQGASPRLPGSRPTGPGDPSTGRGDPPMGTGDPPVGSGDGPARSCQRLAQAAAGAGAVTVAVLDTGLSAHPWYADTRWYAEQRDEVAEVLDADLDHELDARAGHGTFVAGVVLQHAPAARIRAKRVVGGDGVGDELGVVRALAWLASWGEADIVNLSIGCHTYDDRPSPVVARAIAALGPRTAVVACAGNHASDRPYWPAALEGVIAVGALDGDARAWFSDYGPWVDACAPGVGVASCFVRFDGPRPRVHGVDPDAFTGFALWSGTSFAAPAVAGAIARTAAETGLPGAAAAERVLDPRGRRTVPQLGVMVRDA